MVRGPSSFGSRTPEHVGSAAVVCWFSCSMTCGILVPDEGSNLHHLHGKAHSQPRDDQASPALIYFCVCRYVFAAMASLVAQTVKNLPAMLETWV